jgi:hypothetical protein
VAPGEFSRGQTSNVKKVCSGWTGGDGGYHGLGELDRHVAQAAEADDARGARRALGLGAEVGQGRVGRDACAAARISSRPRDRSDTRSSETVFAARSVCSRSGSVWCVECVV